MVKTAFTKLYGVVAPLSSPDIPAIPAKMVSQEFKGQAITEKKLKKRLSGTKNCPLSYTFPPNIRSAAAQTEHARDPKLCMVGPQGTRF